MTGRTMNRITGKPERKAKNRRENDRTSFEQAVCDYYSSLSDEELTELAQWGEFALVELSTSVIAGPPAARLTDD